MLFMLLLSSPAVDCQLFAVAAAIAVAVVSVDFFFALRV